MSLVKYVYRTPSALLMQTMPVYYPALRPHTCYTTRLENDNSSSTVLAFYAHPHLVPPEAAVAVDHRIERAPLCDARHLTSVMRMPAAIFLNSYCDLATRAEMHEIFYIRQQDSPRFK